MLRCGLASDGVYICPSCYQEGGSLLHCPSTLTASNAAVHFCCTVLGVASTGCYPASLPCEARTFLAWHLSACQPRPFILLTSFAKRILSQFYEICKSFCFLQTSKHPPPINSLDQRIIRNRHHLEPAGNNRGISKAASPLRTPAHPGSIREQQRLRILLQHRQFIDQRRIEHAHPHSS